MSLLALLGIGAALVGVGGHISASDTNEKARVISDEAKSIYNKAKASLENAQKDTESSLLKLGYLKKEVLDTSIFQFLRAYERIKNIEFRETKGMNELSNFTIQKTEALQLQTMTDIYNSTIASGAAGAATGAVVALAASGSLPIVTGVLSSAGSALIAGEVGVAAELAGSALSFGAAMTPLAAIAAPVLLFTGINSSIKADENLEKAHTMYAQATAASEQMKNSEILCYAITEKAEMYDNLLNDLNHMFAYCSALLDKITKKKLGLFGNKKINADSFSDDELKVIAVTRALAGAVKSVIDTPILAEDGTVSEKAHDVYSNVTEKLPLFTKEMDKVNETYCDTKITLISDVKKRNALVQKNASLIFYYTRNIAAVLLGLTAFNWVHTKLSNYFISSLTFAIITFIVMSEDSDTKAFVAIKKICNLIISAVPVIYLCMNSSNFTNSDHWLLFDIGLGVVSFLVFIFTICGKNVLVKVLRQLSGAICLFTIAMLLFALLHLVFGLSLTTSIIIVAIPFSLISLAASGLN